MFIIATVVFLAAIGFFIYSFVSWRKGLNAIQRVVENNINKTKETFINDDLGHDNDFKIPDYDASVMSFLDEEINTDENGERSVKETTGSTGN